MARVRQVQVRTHRLVSGALQGAYRSALRGTGIEFEEVREYSPGDDVRAIDWKVTARSGDTAFVKTYVEDRQLTLMLLVDTSASMDFGSTEKTKREVAAEFAALMSFVAAAQQDQVGLCLYADRPGLHLSPRKGSTHVLRVVREVLAAEAHGRGSSLAAVLEHQVRHLRRRSMVFVVSDFHDASEAKGEDWGVWMQRLSGKHDVIAVPVMDPFERALPRAGVALLQDTETGERVEVDTTSSRVRAAWGAAAHAREEARDARLARAGVERIDLSTADRDPADAVIRFFRRRLLRRTRR
jgi:uncharacterized protein (DUF58 family)